MDVSEALSCVSLAEVIVNNLGDLCRRKYSLMNKDFKAHPQLVLSSEMADIYTKAKNNYKAFWKKNLNQPLREKIELIKVGNVSDELLSELKAGVKEYNNYALTVFSALEQAIFFINHDIEGPQECLERQVAAKAWKACQLKARLFEQGDYGGDKSSDPS
ncbi:MAG: hypothetical protein S4CHLAM20_07190 [Chlamydiia bacterium]|nr:hypothetical protein [Chlamydiia bacterium]